MAPPDSDGPDVRKDVTVYLTETRDGWILSVETAHGGELGRYRERALAVLAARTETVARRAWLLVQPRRGPLQFLSVEEMATAVIAGEVPPPDADRFHVR
jgi:hypothetical protein